MYQQIENSGSVRSLIFSTASRGASRIEKTFIIGAIPDDVITQNQGESLRVQPQDESDNSESISATRAALRLDSSSVD